MSRFINLEFGGEMEDQSQGETPGLAGDELFYLQAKPRPRSNRPMIRKRPFRTYGKVLEFNPPKHLRLDRASQDAR